jgi:CDP-paratose 2-epimerase
MSGTILVPGGAGFVGCNLVDSLLQDGHHVIVCDALTSLGSELDLAWLRTRHHRVEFIRRDVRDFEKLRDVACDADVIYHFAPHVAVTASLADPVNDFEVNALGTFNVLEAGRLSDRRPTIVFTSTNKVSGGLEDVVVSERETRYEFQDLPHGISESRPLDFHSPYGCSKRTGDQYVREPSLAAGMAIG